MADDRHRAFGVERHVGDGIPGRGIRGGGVEPADAAGADGDHQSAGTGKLQEAAAVEVVHDRFSGTACAAA
jgi:hypothetical protein